MGRDPCYIDGFMRRAFLTLSVALQTAPGCATPPAALEGVSTGASTGASTAATEGAIGDPCRSGSDCAEGLGCVGDVCVDVCDDLRPCRAPEVCVDGQCVPPGVCDDGVDCDDINACVDGVCAPVPELATCVVMPVWTSKVALAGSGAPVDNLHFRDADGDAARELVGTRDGSVLQVRGGKVAAELLFTVEQADRDITDLAIADLDLDGREDIVIAGADLSFVRADGSAMTVPDPKYIFTDIEVVDEQPGEAPRVGVGLRECHAPDPEVEESCGPELREAWGGRSLAEGSGYGQFARDLASGDFLGTGGRYLLLGVSEGFHLFLPGRYATLDRDVGVVGGPFAVGDLDGDAVDEVVRLTPRAGWTLVTIWRASGTRFMPTLRLRIGGEFATAVALGDIDGDGWTDAILAGTDGVASWFAPGQSEASGCVSPWKPLHLVQHLAIGDHDGDGREELVIAGDDRVTILSAQP